jgi:hypothetical protein
MHYRERLIEYEPPVANSLIVRCKFSICCCISASRMLKKSASGVLTSLRGSPYQSVRLTSSLAAALLDSLFEHPAGDPAPSTYLLPVDLAAQKLSFSANG